MAEGCGVTGCPLAVGYANNAETANRRRWYPKRFKRLWDRLPDAVDPKSPKAMVSASKKSSSAEIRLRAAMAAVGPVTPS